MQPQVRLERRVSPFFASIFYGFMFLAAWVWLWMGYEEGLADLWVPVDPVRDVGIGLAGGLLLAGLTPLVVRWFAPARELEKEFGWILGEQRGWEIPVLAAASGAAEEYMFRGALYGAVGPVLSTLLFAALHWPVNWSFRLWPFVALASGALLAAERAWTGALVAPAITHALVNGVNLWRIARKHRVWKA